MVVVDLTVLVYAIDHLRSIYLVMFSCGWQSPESKVLALKTCFTNIQTLSAVQSRNNRQVDFTNPSWISGLEL